MDDWTLSALRAMDPKDFQSIYLCTINFIITLIMNLQRIVFVIRINYILHISKMF